MGYETPAMGYTAIMTETDRARIAKKTDEPDSKRYESVSRVRNRIEALEKDVEVLKDHHPELLEELHAVVCATDSDGFNEIKGSVDTSLDEPGERAEPNTDDSDPNGFEKED